MFYPQVALWIECLLNLYKEGLLNKRLVPPGNVKYGRDEILHLSGTIRPLTLLVLRAEERNLEISDMMHLRAGISYAMEIWLDQSLFEELLVQWQRRVERAEETISMPEHQCRSVTFERILRRLFIASSLLEVVGIREKLSEHFPVLPGLPNTVEPVAAELFSISRPRTKELHKAMQHALQFLRSLREAKAVSEEDFYTILYDSEDADAESELFEEDDSSLLEQFGMENLDWQPGDDIDPDDCPDGFLPQEHAKTETTDRLIDDLTYLCGHLNDLEIKFR